jgi:hypothetical protein
VQGRRDAPRAAGAGTGPRLRRHLPVRRRAPGALSGRAACPVALGHGLAVGPVLPPGPPASAGAALQAARVAPARPGRAGVARRALRALRARPLPDGHVRDVSHGPAPCHQLGRRGHMRVHRHAARHHQRVAVRRERLRRPGRRHRRRHRLRLQRQRDPERPHRAARLDLLDRLRAGRVPGPLPQQVHPRVPGAAAGGPAPGPAAPAARPSALPVRVRGVRGPHTQPGRRVLCHRGGPALPLVHGLLHLRLRRPVPGGARGPPDPQGGRPRPAVLQPAGGRAAAGGHAPLRRGRDALQPAAGVCGGGARADEEPPERGPAAGHDAGPRRGHARPDVRPRLLARPQVPAGHLRRSGRVGGLPGVGGASCGS